jgi:hypothetical protein
MALNARMAALLMLCCCPAAAAAQAAACGAIADSARISLVGEFSNVQHTDEHAYGYTVTLWRTGDCVFGLFESSQGLQGDTPIGELQSLKYDSKSGKLSFSTKLTTGVVYSAGSNGPEASRDLFRFDGKLRANAVIGVVRHALQDNPNFKPTFRDVILPASKRDAELMPGAMTYGDFCRIWQPVLKRRGPK